jgi:hypothetical protein
MDLRRNRFWRRELDSANWGQNLVVVSSKHGNEPLDCKRAGNFVTFSVTSMKLVLCIYCIPSFVGRMIAEGWGPLYKADE